MKKMMTVISDNRLELERFKQLFQAQQHGKITDGAEDAQEIAKFNEAGQQIIKVREEANQEFQQRNNDSWMEFQKFQGMSMASAKSERKSKN